MAGELLIPPQLQNRSYRCAQPGDACSFQDKGFCRLPKPSPYWPRTVLRRSPEDPFGIDCCARQVPVEEPAAEPSADVVALTKKLLTCAHRLDALALHLESGVGRKGGGLMTRPQTADAIRRETADIREATADIVKAIRRDKARGPAMCAHCGNITRQGAMLFGLCTDCQHVAECEAV